MAPKKKTPAPKSSKPTKSKPVATLGVHMIDVPDTAEKRDPNAVFLTVYGDSMGGVLEPGWTVRADRARTPVDGDVVCVEIVGRGHLVGYWKGGAKPRLEKANPAYEAIALNAHTSGGKSWAW